MKIDTGNFGNAQRRVVSTAIDRGNPAELAEAKIMTARNTQQQQSRVNQAWDEVGQQAQQLGADMWRRQQQLAQQKVGLTIQQKELYAQGVMQDASDQVNTGQLKSADLQKYIADKMSGFKYDSIDDLSEIGRDQLAKGLTAVDMRLSTQTHGLYSQAHQIETRATTDEMIANNERLALNNGPDVTKAAALYDSEGFQQQAREAYGARYQSVITEAKNNLWKTSAANSVLNARDSYSGLNALQQAITDPNGLYHGKLDPDAQIAVLGQIEGRKNTLEAKAEAAAARAEAARNRAFIQQQQHESVAVRAHDNMQEFIASGNVPSDDMLETYRVQVSGTALEGSEKQIAKLSAQTQQFSALPFDQQQAQLTSMAADMRKNGTNPQQVQLFNNMTNAMNKQQSALKADPIAASAVRAQSDIPALPWDSIKAEGTPAEQRASWQTFSEALYQRKGLSDQARAQDRSIPATLLTADEKSQMKAQMESLTPPQRARFLATLQNAGGKLGPQLIKDVGGTDADNAAAYHLNSNPHSNTADLILQGQALQSQKGTNYKFDGSDKTKAQTLIDSDYANAIPVSQRATLQNSVNSYYVAYRASQGADPTKYDEDDYKKSLSAVVGDVVDYGGAGQIIVPAGTDSGTFRDQLYKQIMLQPDGEAINGQLQDGGARLRPVGSRSYMVVQPNNAPFLGSQSGQPIIIEIP